MLIVFAQRIAKLKEKEIHKFINHHKINETIYNLVVYFINSPIKICGPWIIEIKQFYYTY